jgi:outer membrane protein assembly factor BamE (lipoprotein component of BamABCDE complex)
MKTLFFTLISILFLSSCSRPAKDLATVEIGMTKEQVTAIVGEPIKKNVINKTEIWDYPDSNRTIVFRMDTVYSIMTSARARLDSMNIWVDSTNTKAKKGLSKIGDKIENVSEKIGDKLKRDSTKEK